MKKVVKIEVSFMKDFVPFLRNFNRHGKDTAVVYLQECRKRLDTTDLHRIFEYISNLTDPTRWVSATFIWEDSANGSAFWESIDLAWRQFLRGEEVSGESTFFEGKIVPEDMELLASESIQGKFYRVIDLSYNRPVKEEFESCTTWNKYGGEELTETGGRYLILSDYSTDKKMSWHGPNAIPRPMIKVWIPELNRAWWVFYSPGNVSSM